MYPSGEALAQIHVFQGEQCLTGQGTFEHVKAAMKTTRPGINVVLIRLDAQGRSIVDCIIDGVVQVEGGRRRVETGRRANSRPALKG